MRTYAKIYYFHQTFAFYFLRIIFFIILAGLVFVFRTNHLILKLIVLIFNLWVMFEIFVRFKIERSLPIQTSDQASSDNPLNSFTLPTLYSFVIFNSTPKIIQELIKHSSVLFILSKAGLDKSDLQLLDLPVSQLETAALSLSKQVGGIYVSAQDCLVSYLLETEPKTHLLQSKNLRTDELIDILKWGRSVYPEESPKTTIPQLFGEGLWEELTTGWSLETKKYTREFQWSSQVMPSLTGREPEFQQLIQSLSKDEQDDVLLVGNSGTGKDHLVQALAFQSFAGTLPPRLNHKQIIELLVGPLIAGITNRGDLEIRLENLLTEVSHAGNVILYIPEIQNILGASSFEVDISGALLPHLEHGRVPIIATLTEDNFKKYMEQNSLKEVFNVIRFNPPTEEIATQMVLSKVPDIEAKYKVIVSYKAVIAAVEQAGRFLYNQALPGSAVKLLTNAAESVNGAGRKTITDEDVINQIEQQVSVHLHSPNPEEKDLLLHFEDKMHERIIDQVEAVSAISEALRRLRSGLNKSNKPISFLFLGPTGTGKTETVKVLSELYFGGQSNLIRLDMSEYTSADSTKRLLGAQKGEGEERGELTESIKDHPASLVLLDEFEKAHPAILDLFLQILEDGRLTDNKGVTVSFIDSLIVATSNAGSEFIREEVKKGVYIDKTFQQKLLDTIQSKGIFKPELLNRFDQVVVFKPLGASDMPKIVNLLLQGINHNLQESDISIHFDDQVIQKIVQEGFSDEFGARPLRRYIQDTIEDMIAKKKLTDEIKRGSEIYFFVDNSGNINMKVK